MLTPEVRVNTADFRREDLCKTSSSIMSRKYIKRVLMFLVIGSVSAVAFFTFSAMRMPVKSSWNGAVQNMQAHDYDQDADYQNNADVDSADQRDAYEDLNPAERKLIAGHQRGQNKLALEDQVRNVDERIQGQAFDDNLDHKINEAVERKIDYEEIHNILPDIKFIDDDGGDENKTLIGQVGNLKNKYEDNKDNAKQNTSMKKERKFLLPPEFLFKNDKGEVIGVKHLPNGIHDLIDLRKNKIMEDAKRKRLPLDNGGFQNDQAQNNRNPQNKWMPGQVGVNPGLNKGQQGGQVKPKMQTFDEYLKEQRRLKNNPLNEDAVQGLNPNVRDNQNALGDPNPFRGKNGQQQDINPFIREKNVKKNPNPFLRENNVPQANKQLLGGGNQQDINPFVHGNNAQKNPNPFLLENNFPEANKQILGGGNQQDINPFVHGNNAQKNPNPFLPENNLPEANKQILGGGNQQDINPFVHGNNAQKNPNPFLPENNLPEANKQILGGDNQQNVNPFARGNNIQQKPNPFLRGNSLPADQQLDAQIQEKKQDGVLGPNNAQVNRESQKLNQQNQDNRPNIHEQNAANGTQSNQWRIYTKDLSAPVSIEARCLEFSYPTGSGPICVHLGDTDRRVSSKIARDGFYEVDIMNQIQSILSSDPKMGLIDIGAGLGVFTIAAALLSRNVLAVEPLKVNCDMLHKNAVENHVTNRIVLVSQALDNDSYVGLISPINDLGGYSEMKISRLPSDFRQKGLPQASEIVNVTTLNNIAWASPVLRAVLKLDVSNDMESNILEASSEFFGKIEVPYIIIHWFLGQNVQPYARMMKQLLELGYGPKRTWDGPDATLADMRTRHNYMLWKKRG